MRGYFRSQWVVSRLPAELRQPTGQLFHFGGGRDEAASCVCAAPSTKDAPGSVSMAREKLKLPLTSSLRQKQTQFEGSSSN